MKNQCPPLLESNSQDGSPPLLYRPAGESHHGVERDRSGLALERRVVHQDLADVVGLDDGAVARAQPLIGRLDVPDGTLVASEALSTAFRPLTPVAPPADVLMLSQPAPSGWHRTVGMIGVGARLLPPRAGTPARGSPVVGPASRADRTMRLRLWGWPSRLDR